LQDAFSVLHDLIVSKAQHSKPEPLQLSRSLHVFGTLLRYSVTSAINLDDQHRLLAVEIHDVRTDRMLSPELRIF